MDPAVLPRLNAADIRTLTLWRPLANWAQVNFDLDKILQTKREFRRRLAARPIEEKLALLDALRERALAIRSARPVAKSDSLREAPSPHPAKGKQSE